MRWGGPPQSRRGWQSPRCRRTPAAPAPTALGGLQILYLEQPQPVYGNSEYTNIVFVYMIFVNTIKLKAMLYSGGQVFNLRVVKCIKF